MNRIEYYFRQISNIPRESRYEEKICDYIENFAKKHNLKYVRDDLHNIIVYKNAYPGYEDHPVTMLQGHMDMVCEKNASSNHNFETDPIEWITKGNLLYANNTTLGADDGVAVSYMLAILEDSSLKHPALECTFTVQEEIGLIGAKALKKEYFQSKYYINLDTEHEDSITVSCSGGRRVQLTKDVTYNLNNKNTYEIFVTGLLGGHSGELINKERGNSNKIMARLYYEFILNHIPFQLASYQGGLKDNAIPRECRSTFSSDADEKTLSDIISSMTTSIQQELAESDSGLMVTLKKVEQANKVISEQESEEIIKMLYLLPNGFMHRSMTIENLTTVSLNLGTTSLDEQFHCVSSLRSPIESQKDQLSNQIECIAHLFNAQYTLVNNYPGWPYDPDSVLRKKYIDFLQEQGIQVKEVATHGGLETGIIKGILPDIDIIAFGPDMYDIHTPNEHLDLDSFNRCFERLIQFLEIL